MNKIKWSPEDWKTAFIEAGRILSTGIEYSQMQLFNLVQKVLPADKQRANPSTSTAYQFYQKYRVWKKERGSTGTAKGRTRILWTDAERDQVFTKAAELVTAGVAKTKAIERAQKILPANRQRPWNSRSAAQRLLKEFAAWKTSRPALAVKAAPQVTTTAFNFCPGCGADVQGQDWNYCPCCRKELRPI